jgi:hypothetical protein
MDMLTQVRPPPRMRDPETYKLYVVQCDTII